MKDVSIDHGITVSLSTVV